MSQHTPACFKGPRMPLCNPTGRAAASSANSMSGDCTETPVSTADAQAEIERLTALLWAAEARLACTEPETLSTEQTMTMLTESIVQALDRSGTSPESPRKSTKIPDLPILTDSLDPTFESWKIQIQAKLSVNANHFANNAVQIVYIFSCILGNVQKHLNSRIEEGITDPF